MAEGPLFGPPVLLRRDLLFDIGLVATILALLWGSLSIHLLQERNRMLAEAEQGVSNLAGAAEQVLARTIEAIDQRLLFVREAYRRDRLGFSLDFLRQSNGFLDGTTLQVAVIGPAGRLRMSSIAPIVDGIDLSDREHFRFHLDNPRDELFISAPVLGRVSGRWSVQFTRKLLGSDGSFAGVVVVSLDPYWLTHLHDSLEMGQAGLVALVGMDGLVRARTPHLVAALGKDLSDTPAFERFRSKASGLAQVRSPVDGIERIVSHRRVDPHRLIVLVGRDLAEVAAAYHAYRRVALMVGGGLTALILVAGLLLVRHKRRQIASQRALLDAVENIGQGLLMVDRRGRVPVLNRRAVELLGLPPKLLASRPNFRAIARWQREAGEFGPNGAVPPESSLEVYLGRGAEAPRCDPADTPGTAPVYERVRPDGTVLEIRTFFLQDGGAVRTYTDVTERKRREDRIRFLAHHDHLTGLANRILLRERLDQALAEAWRWGRAVAVLALDLDRFKAVNDALGHAAGDQLLAQAAGRLRAIVRAADTVARLGGDEFVVVQVGEQQPAAAEALASRLRAQLAEPYLLDEQEARVEVSVGIAIHPRDGITAEALLRHADMALYRAKSEGRGTLRFYEAEMETRLRDRRLLERDLRRALEGGELDLHYQPIFACGGGDLTGFEALLRWNHPTRGPIPPEEFIALAEESGLVLPLGRWALERACAEAASWPGQLRVAVNLSPAQFRAGDLPGLIAGALDRARLPASRLELEVTEGLLIRDTDEALAAIRALKAQGVRVALDDFGTGHASMGYLRRFPFDRIKIDRSFVGAVDGDGQAQAIVEAILAMSGRLGLKATAEGVETQDQLDFLRRHGCDEAQGFLLGRPVPADQIAIPCITAQHPAARRPAACSRKAVATTSAARAEMRAGGA